MNWVDRYLHAVANYLPDESREDIKQELKISLYEQMEDKTEESARELNEEDQKAFLKQLGHPMKVAAGYAPQQYLIGPSLFPGYKHILKIVISVVIALQVAITVVSIFTGSETLSEMPGLLSRLFYLVILATGCVTGGFAIMEYSGEKLDWYENWNPSSLPPLEPNLRMDRTDNMFNLAFETIGLLWWNEAIGFTNSGTVGNSIWNIGLLEGWAVFYWPVNIILIGAIILHGYHLFSDQWNLPKISIEIVLDVATVVVLYFLLQLEPTIVFKGDVSTVSGDVARIMGLLDSVLWYILLGITVVVMYELYKHGHILYRMKRAP